MFVVLAHAKGQYGVLQGFGIAGDVCVPEHLEGDGVWLLDGVDGWVALVTHFTTASFWLPWGLVFHCIVIDACCLR